MAKKMGFLSQFSPAETRKKKKKLPKAKEREGWGGDPVCGSSLLHEAPYLQEKKQNKTNTNEGREGARNSMAIIAISLPALGARCPVATVFVL